MRDFFNYLIVKDISPNGLFTLHSLYNSYQVSNYINISTELYRLSLQEYVKKNNTGVYEITSKGLVILRESEALMNSIANQKKTKLKIPFEEWKDKIEEYNNLFPKGRKKGSTISFRTPPKELFAKFIWFFSENPEYDWDLVIKATTSYVKAFEEEGDYTYMQTSKYFVKKEDRNRNITSTLASICYNIVEGNDEDINTSGHYYFGP